MYDNLKNVFTNVVSKYTNNHQQIESFWSEIMENYTTKNRFYHNFNHIENMIIEMENLPIIDRDSLVISIFYHDSIYSVTSKTNEEESALLAKKHLSSTQMNLEQIDKIQHQIIATKTHELSIDSDTNFIIDIDLSILGQHWKIYEQYLYNIRKEYAIYPDFMFKAGRKKVVNHFLKNTNIYKTDIFRDKYEIQAKSNLQKEYNLL